MQSKLSMTLIVLMLVLGMTANIVSGQDDGPATPDNPDPGPEGTITFLGHADHPLELVANQFMLAYPNVTVEFVYADDHRAKFQTSLASGDGIPDLYWAEEDMVKLLGSQGALIETTELIERRKDDLAPGKVAETWVESAEGYFGMTGDLSVSGIYYRPDVLEELGVEITDDMTYDDFLVVLDAIAAAGKNGVIYQRDGAFSGFALWSWFVGQYGGSGPTSCDNEEVTLNNEISVQAVELIRAIHETGAMLEADFFSPEYWNAINTDQLVLDLAPAWARGFWETNVDPEQLGKWRLAPLPRAIEGGPNTGVWGGATLIAPASTSEPELALLFMEFAFGSMTGAAAAAEWGIIPSYLPFLEGPFGEQDFPLFGDQDVASIYMELAQNTSTEFCRTSTFGPAIREFLLPRLDEMITGGADIQATLDEVAKEFEEVLPDYQF